MNHHRWTIIDKNGRRNKLGIMHGPRTGNVMVYYNKKVLMVDFLVFGAKTMSFFLDEELYEISIRQEGTNYKYTVRQNLEADTPANRSIKETAREHKRYLLYFVGILLIFLAGGLFWIKQYREQLLVDKGTDTFARLVVKDRGDYQEVCYRFSLGYDFYQSPIKEHAHYAKAPNGFPYHDGDEFQVRFYPDNPSLHQLNYFVVPPKQVRKYIDRAMQVHGLLNYPEREKIAYCELGLAYELKGVEGLSLFYNQQLSKEENKQFNKEAYLRFIRDVPFKESIQDCY